MTTIQTVCGCHEHHRRALQDALRLARKEVTQLTEMIRLLRKAPGMEGFRIGELVVEWRAAKQLELALQLELSKCDAPTKLGDRTCAV